MAKTKTREDWIKLMKDLLETFESQPQVHKEKGDGAYWAVTNFRAQKMRVSAQNRITHLGKVGSQTPDTETFLDLAKLVEGFTAGRLADYILPHPTWPWASRILGVGAGNLPKVTGLIEAFGTHYDVGAPEIPPFVTREPEAYKVVVAGKVVEKVGIWVEGIERLSMVSKLWKYSGWDVDPTGVATKRKSGQKITFNDDLKVATYRLGGAIVRAGSGPTEDAPNRKAGIWYTGGDRAEGYSRGYAGHRSVIRSMKETQGFRIMPTPEERMCYNCDPPLVVVKKKALYCPVCGGKLSLKEEPPGVLYLGHLHQMAMRLMIKDWLICLWVVWRQALPGLPTPPPYNVARLGEPPIDPWKMVDK